MVDREAIMALSNSSHLSLCGERGIELRFMPIMKMGLFWERSQNDGKNEAKRLHSQ